MGRYSISTLSRFLYLNLYAFLLVLLGMGILVIPIDHSRWYLTTLQVLGCLYCLKSGFKLFRSWADKKRKYAILIEKNRDGFRADTFKEFMQAPCGVLLTKLVLKDLGMQSRYAELKRYRSSPRQMMKYCCKRQVTTIKIYGGES